MLEKHFIQVILPLRLEWEPWYYSTEPLDVGCRVTVRNAGRSYIGVVSSVDGVPGIEERRIREISSVESGLERILPSEIDFWKFISGYYLCSIGEVYKYAYPAGEIAAEAKKSKKRIEIRSTSEIQPSLLPPDISKPIAVCGANRSRIYEQYISRTLAEGRDVLIIRPDKAKESFATRREYAKAVRSGVPVVIEGNKSNVFLPFTKLGLVIVDDEDDTSYKSNGAAPRYNGRDAAIMLASIHKAAVIMGSLIPSLETLLNIRKGKYILKASEEPVLCDVETIDTEAEFKKNGMIGDRSRKLLKTEEEVTAGSGKFLEVNSWELGKAFRLKLEKYSLIAVLHAELMTSGTDFRADEKYLHLITRLRSRCRGKLIIQTKVPDRNLSDQEPLLREREQFGFPPYTRLIEIRKMDRQEPLKQFFLKKDKTLAARKAEIVKEIPQGCYIDVDPL